MAYLDRGAANYKNICKEKYEELIKKISTPVENGKLDDFYLAYLHIQEMEKINKEKEELLKKYKSCFDLISSCLPKQFSIYDNLG
jgi:hypothetical protein